MTKLKTRKKKIVINNCFGGFSLSDEAFELYLNKKKIKWYKENGFMGSSIYYKVPPDKYKTLSDKWFNEDGNYKRINNKNWYLSNYDIPRDDAVLIEVIKELGKKANSRYSELKIVEIPSDVDWEISEYDGLEKVEEKHRSWN